ncbi:MAG: hypothetical protein V4747_07545 [Pseudomonadota bacterium]
MRIVSDQSDKDVTARRAEAQAFDALRTLAANLMRVARGAGKPYELEMHAAEFLDAAEAYRAMVGHGLATHDVQNALRVRKAVSTRNDPVMFEAETAIEEAVSGSLQIAASRLVFDGLREKQGESEAISGMDTWSRRRAASKATARPWAGAKGKKDVKPEPWE